MQGRPDRVSFVELLRVVPALGTKSLERLRLREQVRVILAYLDQPVMAVARPRLIVKVYLAEDTHEIAPILGMAEAAQSSNRGALRLAQRSPLDAARRRGGPARVATDELVERDVGLEIEAQRDP